MPLDWTHITPETLAAIDINDVIAGAKEPNCRDYADVIVAAKKAELNRSAEHKCCMNFMQVVLSMRLEASNAAEPFGPVFVYEGGARSPVPSDFPREELCALSEWAFALGDAELRARFCDVIWVQGRKYKAAREAVLAYVESSIRLEDPKSWSSSFKRLERAVRLAVSLGQGGADLRASALGAAREMLLRHRGEDPLYLSHSLIRLLLEFRHGDPAEYASVALAGAANAESLSEFFRANEYYVVAAAAHKKAGAEEEEAAALRKAAEALALEAEKALADMRGPMAAASILSDAVEAMRQAPGGRERADELHARLLEIQPMAREQMTSHSTSTDCTEMVNQAIAAVENKSFRDAVENLCMLSRTPSLESLKEQVRGQAEVAIFCSIMSWDVVNGRGKVVATVPGLLGVTDDITEPALRGRMFQCARLSRSVAAQASINPARRIIHAAHAPDRHDVLALVQYCPWIPPGHHESVARVLVAGFQGDMLLVAHLVPPQFEAVIRHAVERAGGVTSTLEPGGVQKESSLGTLLDTPEALHAFGEAGVFELQDLLTDSLGSNLRNELAHGLMTDDAMFGPEIMYAWWLFLRVCILSSKMAEGAARKGGAGTANSGGDEAGAHDAQ